MRAVVFAGVLGGVVATSDAAPAQDLEAGKRLAQKHCAACHAIGGEGKSAISKAVPFRDFWKKWPNADFDREISRSMTMGAHPRTPKSVSEPEGFASIIAYIRSIQIMRLSDRGDGTR